MSPLSGTWHENQFISSIFFSSVSPAAEVMACPLFRLLVFYIPPVMSTNIHMAECSRLLLTQWRDFDSWSETEESDEDVRRYKFLSRSPAFWVLDLAWPQFCSHLHFHLYAVQRKRRPYSEPSMFSGCISGSVVHEHAHTGDPNIALFVILKKNKCNIVEYSIIPEVNPFLLLASRLKTHQLQLQ